MWEKKNIDFLGTQFISFAPVVTLHFEPDLSVGRLDDPITFVNIPALGLIEISTHMSSKVLVPEFVNAILTSFGSKLFVAKTAGELISGYKDPLMTLAKIFMPKLAREDQFSIMNGVIQLY